MDRTATSGALPGGKPTTTVIGFSGKAAKVKKELTAVTKAKIKLFIYSNNQN